MQLTHVLSRVAAATLGLLAFAMPVCAQVKLEQKPGVVEISINGKPFTVLHADPKLKKTYFHPVLAADGANVTRPLENPKDHPHHKGIWFSVDEVNKARHWMERDPIVNEKVEILQAEGNPAKLRISNTWKNNAGKVLLHEVSTVSVLANRVLIYDVTLKADKEPVEFEDTKEGMFAFRFIDELREKVGAQVINSNGKKTTKECWGQEADWVDYFGKMNGKTYGVTLFDHPLNFRRSRYHVRDYGLFSVSPFGPHAYTNGALPKDEVHLPAGSSLRLRYGIYVHEGNTDEAKVREVYQQFIKNS